MTLGTPIEAIGHRRTPIGTPDPHSDLRDPHSDLRDPHSDYRAHGDPHRVYREQKDPHRDPRPP